MKNQQNLSFIGKKIKLIYEASAAFFMKLHQISKRKQERSTGKKYIKNNKTASHLTTKEKPTKDCV